MSRNHQPLTDDEIAELREKMDAQRTDIRAALAEDLDSDPDADADVAVAPTPSRSAASFRRVRARTYASATLATPIARSGARVVTSPPDPESSALAASGDTRSPDATTATTNHPRPRFHRRR